LRPLRLLALAPAASAAASSSDEPSTSSLSEEGGVVSSRLLSAADAARRLAATAPRWAFEYSILKDVLFSSCKSAALLPSPFITLTVSSMSRRSALVLAWRRDVAIRRVCAFSAAVVHTLTVL